MIKDTVYREYEKLLSSYSLQLSDCPENSIKEEITKSLEEIISAIISSIEADITVRIFWIMDYSVNASVAKVENTYCIGLCDGIITSMVYRLESICYDDIIIEDSSFFLKKPIYFSIMKDKTANGILGNFLFTMALFYIVMHEFGHILCGHCDKTKEPFNEICFETGSGKGGYKSQGKEYAADFYGVANSLNIVLASSNDSEEEMINCLGLYITSVNFVFWLFNNDSKEFEPNKSKNRTHPHPIVRLGYFIELLENELQHELQIFQKHGAYKFNSSEEETVTHILRNAVGLFFNLADSSGTTMPMNTVFSEDCSNEIIEIKKASKIIQDDYKDVAFVHYH